MGMLLPARLLGPEAGCEPLVFCLHHLVLRGTRSPLGSVIAGTPEGLVKTAGFLDFFFADKPCRPAFLDRVTS